ncbi:hypothetical protein C5S53_16755 [Methanophagales archaeon]|nr:hypothetical protein C5S53_16755 [Methanophagales archaeon]
MDLKDFIYLDIDRVRSFTSQLFEGIPETSNSKNGKEQDIKGKFKGGVPLLASGGVEGGLLLRQEKTETKSLQHYIYVLFENKLNDLKKLKVLNEKFDKKNWVDGIVRKGLKESEFIKITANVKIFDYEYLDTVFKMVKELPDTVAELTSMSLTKDKKKQKKREMLKEMGAQDWDSTIRSISKFIDTMYKGIISLKIYPVGTDSAPYLLGRLNKNYLQYDRETLLFQYGTEPNQKWTIVGQISTIPDKKETTVEEPQLKDEYNMLDVENIMEYILKIMVSTGLKFSVSYPSIGIIPLAIYRV